jgi:hypothetical protein
LAILFDSGRFPADRHFFPPICFPQIPQIYAEEIAPHLLLPGQDFGGLACLPQIPICFPRISIGFPQIPQICAEEIAPHPLLRQDFGGLACLPQIPICFPRISIGFPQIPQIYAEEIAPHPLLRKDFGGLASPASDRVGLKTESLEIKPLRIIVNLRETNRNLREKFLVNSCHLRIFAVL